MSELLPRKKQRKKKNGADRWVYNIHEGRLDINAWNKR